MPAHTHTAEFDPADLSSTISSTADLSSATVTGTLSCNTTPGGSTNPQNAYPGTSTNSGADNWANFSDNAMAADVIDSAQITKLAFNTTFAASNVTVPMGSTGDDNEVSVNTALPTDCIEFVIALDGLFPPRP